jgi:hypothetical protein
MILAQAVIGTGMSHLCPDCHPDEENPSSKFTSRAAIIVAAIAGLFICLSYLAHEIGAAIIRFLRSI